MQKTEESYVQFLIKKQVKMFEHTTDAVNPITYEQMKETIQAVMKEDRDMIDKASNAFVSFVRYYKEHAL